MDQTLALEIMSEGEHVLLTGPAGSGKTFVLNEFIKRAKAEGKSVSVTATTGLAATHVNGNTIHAWSGIGVLNALPAGFADNLPKGRRDTIVSTDILIIDEISMLHDYRLDMVDEVCRTVRREYDKPFGGIQVIMCGDFFQLPPVSRSGELPSQFVTHSQVWAELDPVICYLQDQYRQDDDTFYDILQALRAGDVRRRHVEALLNRQDSELADEEITELHTTNVDVDQINQMHLKALPGETHYYQMVTTGSQNYVESLKRSCLAPEVLELKLGALVMFIKNSPDRRYANGSLGTVIDFDSFDAPVVKLKNGKTINVQVDSWELRDGTRKRAGLAQLPLRLAWAITVHKSQGMTLDAARIDLRRAFVEGMGYVALSRVKRLDSLSLAGINQMALKVSPEALAIDAELQHRSALAAEHFALLRDRAAKRAKRPAKTKPTKGDWQDKLTKMRSSYPNAFKPWTDEDDKLLLELFSQNTSVNIDELVTRFGRHPGSIRARLKKHLGEDAVA